MGKNSMCGEVLEREQKSFIGNQAVNQLETLYANKAFVSCTAVNRKFGVTETVKGKQKSEEKM